MQSVDMRGQRIGIIVHEDSIESRDCFYVSIITSGFLSKTRQVFQVFETEEGTVRIEYRGKAFEIFDRELNPLVVGIS